MADLASNSLIFNWNNQAKKHAVFLVVRLALCRNVVSVFGSWLCCCVLLVVVARDSRASVCKFKTNVKAKVFYPHTDRKFYYWKMNVKLIFCLFYGFKILSIHKMNVKLINYFGYTLGMGNMMFKHCFFFPLLKTFV